jgi:transcriptional regulator
MKIPYEKRAEVREPFMTLAEIADVMGMSRERVRQIEQRALGKVKRALMAKGMTAEDFFSTLKYMKPIKPTQGEILSDSIEYELMEKERSEDE